MSDGDESRQIDLLGLGPFSRKAAEVLGLLIEPAATEIGEHLGDYVREWRERRLKNLREIAARARAKLGDKPGASVHPRIVETVIAHGGMVDDAVLQDMWAGLLAASCQDDVPDDGNIIYFKILEQLSPSEARLLNWLCENAEKRQLKSGLPAGRVTLPEEEELIRITEVSDLERLDAELSHMHSLVLFTDSAAMSSRDMRLGRAGSGEVRPTGMAFQLCLKCRGASMGGAAKVSDQAG